MKLRHPPTRLAVATAVLALLGSTVLLSAQASSHREAPFITTVPKVDATDFYMFRSYEQGRTDYVTLIANYQPLQDAYGGPNYFSMDPNALYEIHVDNNGDAKEDLSFQFRFNNTLAGNGAGVNLNVGGKMVNIPLIQAGAVANVKDANLQVAQTYSVQVMRGGRRGGTAAAGHDDGSAAAAPSTSRSTTSARRRLPTTPATPPSTSTTSTCPDAAHRPGSSSASARILLR